MSLPSGLPGGGGTCGYQGGIALLSLLFRPPRRADGREECGAGAGAVAEESWARRHKADGGQEQMPWRAEADGGQEQMPWRAEGDGGQEGMPLRAESRRRPKRMPSRREGDGGQGGCPAGLKAIDL
jgi:hypothetical protein